MKLAYFLSLLPLIIMAEPLKNRLGDESSPYLKLHAQQPVHWMAWCDEAFQKAKKENKPVLLSIGYSTCHWCHVMARESFEDQEIADYLNEHFISIKLDREERPDIDAIYMSAHQAMHEGAGGWPLNVFLTPDRKPFFSGTYFPPRAKANRAGFDHVIRGVNDAWTGKQEKVKEFSVNLIQQLESLAPEPSNTSEMGKNFIPHTQSLTRSAGDPEYFGWGRGPKFPQASLIRFLLLSDEKKDRIFALETCSKMAESGLYDHINGGFHRYCVDREWIVPHFEKMLYDQAQLIEVYLDAYLVSGEKTYATVAEETCNYLLRAMLSPDGVFYCAQDAQSEGKEGKFSCWTMKQLKSTFSQEEVNLLTQHFDLTEDGNFYDFSDPEALKKQNVLVVKKPISEFSPTEQKALVKLKKELFNIRSKRVPPATDKKILLNWNSLAIAALARAAYILDSPRYIEVAEKAYQALLMSHLKQDGFYHSGKDGQYHGENIGSDLSSLLYATRTLYHCTLKGNYLTRALSLTNNILEEFYDPENGGFYETQDDPALIMKLKGDFDHALPTVSSQMVRELSILAHLTDQQELKDALEKTLTYHQATLQTMPSSLGEMLLALAQTQSFSTLSLLSSSGAHPSPFIMTAYQSIPYPIIISNDKGMNEFYRSLKPPSSGVLAFLCKDKACQLPTSDLKELKKQLKAGAIRQD